MTRMAMVETASVLLGVGLDALPVEVCLQWAGLGGGRDGEGVAQSVSGCMRLRAGHRLGW